MTQIAKKVFLFIPFHTKISYCLQPVCNLRLTLDHFTLENFGFTSLNSHLNYHHFFHDSTLEVTNNQPRTQGPLSSFLEKVNLVPRARQHLRSAGSKCHGLWDNPGGSDELGPGHKCRYWRMKKRGVWPS